MGNLPARSQFEPSSLRAQRLRTNLWFECGAAEMSSWRANYARHGGFDPWTRTMTPLRGLAKLDRAQFVLDSIAAASEEQLFDREHFVTACFASAQECAEFLRELERFGAYWVNERHFYAMLDLLGEENACTTYARIARGLAALLSKGAAPASRDFADTCPA
jgi:hypothetical protein